MGIMETRNVPFGKGLAVKELQVLGCRFRPSGRASCSSGGRTTLKAPSLAAPRPWAEARTVGKLFHCSA